MLTEYHCHILPGIDDGAADADTALAMVGMMQAQGVERIVATPHFYAHREQSVAAFLERRQEAFGKIEGKTAISDIRLGAEVAIEHGLSELEGIERLAIAGTDLILLELPYRGFKEWMLEEAYNVGAEHQLRIIFAHVHRYLEYYNKEEMARLLSMRAMFQINNEAFETHAQRSFVRSLLRDELPLVYGSDAHDLGERRPNWNLLLKKGNPESIEASDRVLDRHTK